MTARELELLRVVIVDDQSRVRAGFRMILESEDGIEVVAEASDGEEAVRAVRQTGLVQLAPDAGVHSPLSTLPHSRLPTKAPWNPRSTSLVGDWSLTYASWAAGPVWPITVAESSQPNWSKWEARDTTLPSRPTTCGPTYVTTRCASGDKKQEK